jgi:hypothetical protein
MWAKETVLRENRLLREENDFLWQQNRELERYIQGIRLGMRRARGRKE